MAHFDSAQEFPVNLLSAPEKQCVDLVLTFSSLGSPIFSAPVLPYTVDDASLGQFPHCHIWERQGFKLMTLCWDFNHYFKLNAYFQVVLMNSVLIAENAK